MQRSLAITVKNKVNQNNELKDSQNFHKISRRFHRNYSVNRTLSNNKCQTV